MYIFFDKFLRVGGWAGELWIISLRLTAPAAGADGTINGLTQNWLVCDSRSTAGEAGHISYSYNKN